MIESTNTNITKGKIRLNKKVSIFEVSWHISLTAYSAAVRPAPPCPKRRSM
jgi:hypothetical protein